MAELKCPHCGKTFAVDDTELNSIVQQIRNAEFERDLSQREAEIKQHLEEKHKLELDAKENEIKLQDKDAYDKQIADMQKELTDKEGELQRLQLQIDSNEESKKLAVMEAAKGQ